MKLKLFVFNMVCQFVSQRVMPKTKRGEEKIDNARFSLFYFSIEVFLCCSLQKHI